jgi:hypothetical protein
MVSLPVCHITCTPMFASWTAIRPGCHLYGIDHHGQRQARDCLSRPLRQRRMEELPHRHPLRRCHPGQLLGKAFSGEALALSCHGRRCFAASPFLCLPLPLCLTTQSHAHTPPCLFRYAPPRPFHRILFTPTGPSLHTTPLWRTRNGTPLQHGSSRLASGA